ncbi:response regulator transcription factor [Pleomorphovibrio marinus]|uniref:response regulator transcription factor n=1 Tax=Pleomorphovibrio marinus TaxID=2164132 RepID=UPI000E0BED62|nr:response regulator transcription factor [Pleomorphovibrio marinus]
MKEIRIILADDHRMFAKGIENLLKKERDLKVIGVFNNGKQVLQQLTDAPVDLLITDMNMPGMDGFSLIQHIKKEKTSLKIIVLSMYDEEEIFKKCIKQGVDAYVLKNADPDELIYTIREVIENRHVAHFQRVLEQAEDDIYHDLDVYKLKFKLSKREFEILKYLAKGMSNKDIADMLHLSIHTVETHRKHIYTKLKVSTSAELIKKAIDMGLG